MRTQQTSRLRQNSMLLTCEEAIHSWSQPSPPSKHLYSALPDHWDSLGTYGRLPPKAQLCVITGGKDRTWLSSTLTQCVLLEGLGKLAVARVSAILKLKVIQPCPTLWDPMDYTVHGILQARILEWVAFPFSSGSSQPRDWSQVSCTAGEFFTNWTIRGALNHPTPPSLTQRFWRAWGNHVIITPSLMYILPKGICQAVGGDLKHLVPIQFLWDYESSESQDYRT